MDAMREIRTRNLHFSAIKRSRLQTISMPKHSAPIKFTISTIVTNLISRKLKKIDLYPFIYTIDVLSKRISAATRM
jgi:hypothetical protein